jgi:predicted TIM-barrel fold metal-dependent hydrolase
MLIDFHVSIFDEDGYGDALADMAGNLGFDRLCIGGGHPCYGLASNAEVRRVADTYAELFVPFAYMDLGEDGAHTVERLSRVGFKGLLLSAPPAAYDDESFFSVYEAAEALSMPVVFHTGFLPRSSLDRARRIRCENMRPVFLDSIARAFPGLTIVGVGLGNPWCDEAVEVLRRHGNVFFDLSGGVLRQKTGDFLHLALHPEQTVSFWGANGEGNLLDHIVFGSAARYEAMPSVERDYQRHLRSMVASREEIDAVMGHTAARILEIPVSPVLAERE